MKNTLYNFIVHVVFQLVDDYLYFLFVGAGGGIGRATCQLLAEAGAKIVAVDANITSAKDTLSLCTGNMKNHSRTRVHHNRILQSGVAWSEWLST